MMDFVICLHSSNQPGLGVPAHPRITPPSLAHPPFRVLHSPLEEQVAGYRIAHVAACALTPINVQAYRNLNSSPATTLQMHRDQGAGHNRQKLDAEDDSVPARLGWIQAGLQNVTWERNYRS